MKVSGFFVILLTQDGFKSDCPERKSFAITSQSQLRSRGMQMFFKIDVTRNFLLTGNFLCWSLFLIKLQALWSATLFQPRPKRDFYKQLFLYNTSGGSFCQIDQVTVQ